MGTSSHALREDIADSWRYCVEIGLRPERLNPPRREVEAEHGLLRVGGQFVDGFGDEVHDTGIAVVLSDGTRWCSIDTAATTRHAGNSTDDARARIQLESRGRRHDCTRSDLTPPHTCPCRGGEHFMDTLKAITTTSAPIVDDGLANSSAR